MGILFRIPVSASHWFSYVIDDASGTTSGYNTVAPAGGNLRASGWHYDGIVGGPHLHAVASSGSLTWQQHLAYPYPYPYIGLYNITSPDSNNNVYMFGRVGQGSQLPSNTVVLQFDSVGALGWQKEYDIETSSSPDRAVYDGSGTTGIVIGGWCLSSSVFSGMVMKLGISGSVGWCKVMQSPIALGSMSTSGLAVDTSGNIYASMTHGANATSTAVVAKLNSSGGIVWQRELTNPTSNFETTGLDVGVDGQGNVYMCGRSADTGVAVESFLAKYNASGTLQWQQKVQMQDMDVEPLDMVVGSDGYIYVLIRVTGLAEQGLIVKYDDQGTLIWQRTLEDSGTIACKGISVDSAGNIYVAGNMDVDNVERAFVAKLPTSGALTGTYGTFTYAASSFTAGAATYTDAAASVVELFVTPTVTTSTFATTPGNLSTTVIPVV